MKGAGLPQTCANEHALIAVAEEIVDRKGAADRRIGAELDPLEFQMTVRDIVQHRIGKPEIRNTVTHHAADLVLAVKDCDAVAVAGQDDRDSQSGGAGADDGNAAAVGGLGALNHLIGIGRGDVIFDNGEVDGNILDTPDTVTLALLFMVADKRANRGKRIILK